MNQIKKKREKLDLTQGDVAGRLGIDRSSVAKWETGESLPRADKLPDLAKILECSIDDLLKSERR